MKKHGAATKLVAVILLVVLAWLGVDTGTLQTLLLQDGTEKIQTENTEPALPQVTTQAALEKQKTEENKNDFSPVEGNEASVVVEEDGYYYSKEEVSEYLRQYQTLPENFITKDEAKELGWESKEGNLWEVAPDHCIGGERFGNREGLLPTEDGRVYYECDIDYEGGYRGEKRIVYSNDGMVYYTDDHYESFEFLGDFWE